MKLVFFGSSLFSLPFIEVLHKHHSILAVVSTPDEKKGRGQKEGPTPVKEWSLKHKLNCLTPENLKTSDFLDSIHALKPELSVIVSYGKLLPDSLLAIPPKGNLNVHPSLLPQYRGAAPVQWAILNGDVVTGITIMRPTSKMDAGDVLLQKSLGIGPDENAEELSQRLSEVGKQLLLEGIEILQKNPSPVFHVQDDRLASYAPKIEKEEGLFSWKDPASLIHRKVRALQPWPVAYTQFGTEMLRIFRTHLEESEMGKSEPGKILKVDKQNGFLVQTGEGTLWVNQLQLAGKKILDGFQFLMGQRLKTGMMLSPAQP